VSRDCCSGISSDERSGLLRDRVGIGKNIDFHHAFPQGLKPCVFSLERHG
jgi:hypothetical protein